MMEADKLSSLISWTTLILLMGIIPLKKSSANQKSEIPILQQTEIPYLIIEKIEYYNGKELYGYINGGAEIYLEYGFQKLALQKIVQAGKEITIEIYHMRDPAAALGIFSVFNRNDLIVESLELYSCLSKYQLNFAMGHFYVNITNFEGTPSLRQISKNLAEKIHRKIDDRLITIPEFFQNQFTEAELRQIKYCRGKLGMQNIWPEFVPFIENLKNYSVYLLQIDHKEHIINIAELALNSEKNMKTFLKNFVGLSAEAEEWQIVQLQEFKIAVKNRKDLKVIYIQTSVKNPDFHSFLKKLDLDGPKNDIK